MVEISMEVRSWLRKRLGETDPDLLREMVSSFVHMLMSAEADALCGAGYGERSDERINRRSGYREREFDTRGGTMPLAIPKLRQGSYPSTLRRECMGFRSEGAGPNLRWLRALSLTCRPLAALPGLT